jgi:predicted MFS family arabinose efflux permease
LCTLAVDIVALGSAAAAGSAASLLVASLFIGLGSVAVQMLVPIAAHLARDVERGRVVGNVMSGLLVGIMLSRPVAGIVASSFGWRTVFGASAVLMAALAAVLWRMLPVRRPRHDSGYGALLASLWTVLRDTPLLRRRASYQALLFAGFILYWTAVPLALAAPPYLLSQRGIALFSLAGVAGAAAAPIAGRLADRGHTRIATLLALAIAAAAFPLTRAGPHPSVALMLAGGILLDFGVQANLVLGQRAIYSLGSHLRSRLNGLYMAMFFIGGGIGSAIASVAMERGGWSLVGWIGLALPTAALLYYLSEPRMRYPAKNSDGRT